jgi:hypothetical protein
MRTSTVVTAEHRQDVSTAAKIYHKWDVLL